MIRTNLTQKNRTVNYAKLQRANAAFAKTVAAKPQVTIIHAQVYPSCVSVYYLLDAEQNECRINLKKLEDFAREYNGLLPGKVIMDMNIATYIHDNLGAICKEYIAAGKEVTRVR
jgi:hypothetical protein